MIFRKKSLYGLFLAAMAFANLTAPALAASHKGDKPALREELADFEVLSGRFEQTKTIAEVELTLQTSGSFEVHKKTSIVHWNIEKPKNSTICIDKEGVAIRGGGTTKSFKFSEVGNDVGRQVAQLTQLMSMDRPALEKEFNIKKEGSLYKLTPKEKAAMFSSAEISVGARGLVERVVLKEKSGDSLDIRFSKMVTSKESGKESSCAR